MSKVENFIGSKKVRMTLIDPDDDTNIKVMFKDSSEVITKKKLYDAIVRQKKGNGNTISEVANVYIAAKFVKELAEYGYERYEIEGVATAIGNIVHNLCEEKIGEKFGVGSSLNIKLSDII